MIKGIGADIFEIDRMTRISDANSFLKQTMNDNEIKDLANKDHGRRASSRFTIKEAVLKALGCGLTTGFHWKNIEINQNDKIELKGALKKIADRKAIKNIFCSSTSSKKLSVGFVIIENHE
jgi:holo-[acyl-carrier protein] synthase